MNISVGVNLENKKTHAEMGAVLGSISICQELIASPLLVDAFSVSDLV